MTLSLANKITWKLQLSEHYKLYSENYPDIKQNNLEIHIDLIPIDKIHEHEVELPNKNEIDSIVDSIQRKGFLHPILVTEHNDYWILADGTHRKKALEKLNCKFIPAIILKDSDSIRRDTWVRIFNSRMPSYKQFYKKLSPHQRKNIVHKQFDIIHIETLIEYQYKEDLIAVYKDGTFFHVFLNKEFTNRLDHLKLIKIFDQTFDSDDKSYIMVSKANEKEFNFNEYILLPSPIDSLKDLEYLVKYKELRRSRASRVIIPLRLIHIPLDYKILKLSKEEAEDAFENIFQNYLKQDLFRTIFLKLSITKSLDISWYYHILLIGTIESFLTDVPEEEKEKVSGLLENIESFAVLNDLNIFNK